MTRRYNSKESARKARAKRDLALERLEFRLPSEPRAAPTGPTSFPVKIMDESIRALIDAELARRATPRRDSESMAQDLEGWNEGRESA